MPKATAPRLEIFLLGSPHVAWDGGPLVIQRRNVRGLLYRLAADLELIPRASLCLLFWSEKPETVARRNLTHLLTHLRMALPEPDALRTTEDMAGLDVSGVWCDVVEFRRLTQRGKRETEDLRHAIELYRGPFLAGVSLSNCSECEYWLSLERSSLERLYLDALETLIDCETVEQDYDRAIRHALRYLETDDLAEEIHRRLIALYAAMGDRNAALRQFEQCVTVLERELGVSPLPETRAVFQAVLEGHVPSPSKLGIVATLKLPKPLGLDVPLVGREQAWHRLEEALRGARAGLGQIVLISGEAGAGKSRLMRDFAERCQPEARLLFGNGYPGGQAIPYRPIVDAIRFIRGSLPPTFYLHPTWLAEVSRLLPELHSQFPDLPAPMASEPEDARIRLFDALSLFILSIVSASQMTVLCFDDLQWVDRTTLEWLIHFGRQLPVRDCHLLILGSYRVEEAEEIDDLRRGLNRLGIVSELKLKGLGEPAVLELLHHLMGCQPGDVLLAARLRKATGGNPLFLLELIRTLIEGGSLEGDLGSLEDFPLPKGVQEAVEGRLRQLDAKTRQVLDASAVLGPIFNFDGVRLTAGRNEIETVDSLDTLTARHWLVEQGEQYQFVHDLTHQAVEASLSPVRRQLLHRRAGRALEQLDPGATSTLAYHFDIGGHPQKALHYRDLAARQAEALFAWQEAEKHQTRMLELMQQLDPTCTNPEYLAQRGHILTSWAHMHFLQGRLAERDADLAAVAALAEASGNEPLRLQVLHHRIRYLNLDGRYEEAIALSEAGLSLASRLEDIPARSRFLAQIGFAHYFLGQPRPALAALEVALALEGSETDPERYGRIVHILGYVHFHLGDYARSLARQQEACACHQQIGDDNRVAWDTIDVGSCYLQMGRYAEAKKSLDEGLELARRIGARLTEAYGLTYLGYWELYQGNYAAAQTFFQQALPAQETLTIQHVRVSVETGMGLACLHLNELAAARRWLERAVDHARSIDLRRRLSDALIGLGLVEIAANRFSAACPHLTEAVELARAGECYESMARGVAALARLERMSGDLSGALNHANDAVRIAQEIAVPTCEMWGEMEIGMALLALGRPVEALGHSQRAVALTAQAHAGWIPKEQVQRAHAQIARRANKFPSPPDHGFLEHT